MVVNENSDNSDGFSDAVILNMSQDFFKFLMICYSLQKKEIQLLAMDKKR